MTRKRYDEKAHLLYGEKIKLYYYTPNGRSSVIGIWEGDVTKYEVTVNGVKYKLSQISRIERG